MINHALNKFKKLIDKEEERRLSRKKNENKRSGLLDHSQDGEMVFVDQL